MRLKLARSLALGVSLHDSQQHCQQRLLGQAVAIASAESAATGCGILGTGGGGDPYINRLKVLRELDRQACVRLRTPSCDPHAPAALAA